MPRYLILDADGPHATLVVANISRGGLAIEQVRHWTTDTLLTPASAESLGRKFRDDLAAWKIPLAPLVLGVGRDRVIFKEIKHPAVPAAEEPAIVRFQAVKELTDSADEVVIDYQPREAVGTERRALVVATKKEVVRMAQLLAQPAGLKIHAIIPRPFALVAATRAVVPPPEATAVIAILALGDTGGEFVVARGSQVLFARPVAAPALANDQTLLSELRRNLAIHAGQNPSSAVKSLYVAESAGRRSFADVIRSTLAIPVYNLEPLAGTGKSSTASAGQLASAVGMGRLLAQAELPINFIKPREPKPVTDPNRRPILLGVGLAVAVLLGLGMLAWMQLSARDDTMWALRREMDSLTTDLARIEPEAKRADEVNKWLDGQVVWLDELYDLASRCPDLTKLRITQLALDPSPKGVSGRKHYVGRVSIDGLAANDDTALKQFMNELQSEPHYLVEAKGQKPLGFGADRRLFSYQFSTKFDLEKRPTDQYIRALPAEDEKKSRGFNFLNLGGGQR